MTAPPAFVLDEIRRRRERRGPVWNGLVLTTALVAAGFLVASMTLAPAPTPGNVVNAYVDALFARDWSAAWDLLCRPARAANAGYAAYAEKSRQAFQFLPHDVDVATDRLRIVGEVRPGIAVPVMVTSDELDYENWHVAGVIVVVREGDAFRVCSSGVTTG